MHQKFAVIMIVTAGLFAGGATSLAQNRPYDLVMQEIGGAFRILNENLNDAGEDDAPDSESADPTLDAESAAAAIEAAASLEGLFEEVEAFWAPFNSKYALDLAKDAREGAVAVGVAARTNNIEMAQDGYSAMQATCRNCHYTHREETDTGYLIRP